MGIKTRISALLAAIRRRRNHRRMFVILDGADNSVTLSKALFQHMDVEGMEQAKVFAFRIAGTGDFGFAVNPPIDQPTQMADIQYNSKYRCIGFESLNPTVQRMLYDYGLPPMSRVKLSVEHCTANDMSYYRILR